MAAAKKGSHTWSILTGKDKRCFVTGRTEGLQKHHIFYGRGRREISDKNGFWVWLTAEEHLAGLGGLHAHPGKGLDLALKCLCQRKYEEKYGREQMVCVHGKEDGFWLEELEDAFVDW